MAFKINDLCPEIFVNYIFRHLCHEDLIRAMLTCKKWKTYVLMLYRVDERTKCKLLLNLNTFLVMSRPPWL